MPIIHLFTYEAKELAEAPKAIQLSRVPVVGEYISLSDDDDGPEFQVKAVNHLAFQHPDFVAAEVIVAPTPFKKA